MKPSFFSPVRRASLFVCLALVLAVITSAQATTHVIQFGGSLGDAYSPSSLSVSVGDTITWEGDFSAHPLSSTSVPTGAATFQNSSGTVFSYVVTVAGSYAYQCDIHFSLGMVGSFTAVATGVIGGQLFSQPADFRLEQNYPNPFNPSTTIRFDLKEPSSVTFTLYNVLGQKVGERNYGIMQAGRFNEDIDMSQFASGVYVYRITAVGRSGQEFSALRKMMLLK